ncbi:MAG: type II secretion system protein [Candidatus Omnitrophota bacterium]
MNRSMRRSKGFTVIELVTALAVLAIIAVTIVFPGFRKAIDTAREKSEAATVKTVREAIDIKYSDNLANRITPAYPEHLDDAAQAAASPSNPLFTNVLGTGVTKAWTKTGVDTYTGPTGESYAYDAETGQFGTESGNGGGDGGEGDIPEYINLSGNTVTTLPVGEYYFSSFELTDNAQLLFEGEGTTILHITGVYNVTGSGTMAITSGASPEDIHVYAPDSAITYNTTLDDLELPVIKSSASVTINTTGNLYTNDITSSGPVTIHSGGTLHIGGFINANGDVVLG